MSLIQPWHCKQLGFLRDSNQRPSDSRTKARPLELWRVFHQNCLEIIFICFLLKEILWCLKSSNFGDWETYSGKYNDESLEGIDWFFYFDRNRCRIVVCVCVRESERARNIVLCEREWGRECCVCVCVCVREREREREEESAVREKSRKCVCMSVSVCVMVRKFVGEKDSVVCNKEKEIVSCVCGCERVKER